MKTVLVFVLSLFCAVILRAAAPAIPVDSAGYFRLISFEGKTLTPWVKLEGLKYTDDQFNLLAKQNSKWGVVNDSLVFCIPPKYDSIFPVGPFLFCESLFNLDIYQNNVLIHSVTDYESVEYKMNFNYEGDFANQDDFRYWMEYKFIFKTLNGVYITDSTFLSKTENEFDDAFFMDEIIYVRRADKFGFQSLQKNVVVEPIYKSIGMFNGGVVELKDNADQRHYFLLDGKELPLSDSILQYFPESGLFKIYKGGKGYLYDMELNQYANYQGDDIFNLQSITEFPYSYVLNTDYFAFKINQSIGVCDKKGSVILSPVYKQIFYAGKDRFIVTKDTLYGVVDQSGNWILQPVYTFIETPSLDFFRVHNQDKKGLLDKNGKTIVPIEYSEIHCSVNGILTLKNGRFGYYNFDGERILENEWHTVYRLKQDCYEMVDVSGKRCVVNQKGVQTPVNCDNVYVGDETLKYYLEDNIVVIRFVKGVKLDSTIYPRNASVVVSRDQERTVMIINTFDCVTYRNQLNGKVGSKKKNNIGDAFLAAFDNHFSTGPEFVTETNSIDFYLAGNKFQTKETVMSFFGDGCSKFGNYLFYLRPAEFGYWHSTSLDGTYSTSNEYDYAAENRYKESEMTGMLVREGFALRSLTEGELNMESGQFFADFRPYYEDMNSLNNLVITDVNTFGLLSSSPPIFVESPAWHVLAIFERSDFSYKGTYSYYYRTESGGAIFSTDNLKYGIWFEGGENIANEIYSEIIPVAVSGYQYYLVNLVTETLDGAPVSEWTVFDNTGQILPAFYDSVAIKSFGFFEVVKNDQRFILDKSGKVVYTYL